MVELFFGRLIEKVRREIFHSVSDLIDVGEA